MIVKSLSVKTKELTGRLCCLLIINNEIVNFLKLLLTKFKETSLISLNLQFRLALKQSAKNFCYS